MLRRRDKLLHLLAGSRSHRSHSKAIVRRENPSPTDFLRELHSGFPTVRRESEDSFFLILERDTFYEMSQAAGLALHGASDRCAGDKKGGTTHGPKAHERDARDRMNQRSAREPHHCGRLATTILTWKVKTRCFGNFNNVHEGFTGPRAKAAIESAAEVKARCVRTLSSFETRL